MKIFKLNCAAWTMMLTITWVSRNDDHGGDLLPRIQAAVDALVEYRERFGLDLDLIFVEWNAPNPDLLRGHVRFPPGFPVRWYEVPLTVHRQFPNWQQFALWPHIGANVGMRRARGSWVLTTTHDCIWSEELAFWLAGAGNYRTEALYRTCRFDAHAQLELERTTEQRIAIMEKHMIKRNTWKRGAFTKSCGDFIMMPKFLWHKVRGYPEYPVNGIWLDGLLMHNAFRLGARQVVLPWPNYHMEHEGRGLHIYKGLPHVPRKIYLKVIRGLARGDPAFLPNGEDWGLAQLEERQIADNAWVLEGDLNREPVEWPGGGAV